MSGALLNGSIFTPPRIITDNIKEAPLSQLVPIWLLVLANFYFGIDTRLTVGHKQAGGTKPVLECPP